MNFNSGSDYYNLKKHGAGLKFKHPVYLFERNSMSGSRAPLQVKVKTTARLHMGFFDMHGGLGRRFGSIGLSLEQPATLITASHADDFSAVGLGAPRAVACARLFAERVDFSGGVHLAVDETIPEHAGLGSGTQMALAVGMAITRLHLSLIHI